MLLFSINFLLYTIIGLWRPLDWSSKRSKFIYSVSTFVTMYLLIYLVLNHSLYVVLVADNIEDFALAFFIGVGSSAVFVKAIATIKLRDNIIYVMKILQERPYIACNEEESYIQEKFDRSIRSYTIYYLILATGSVVGGVVKTTLDGLEGILPYNMWVPWNCTSFLVFWLTLLQEVIALIVATIVNVASETLIFGFCMQICVQFEILKHRLERIMAPRKREEIFKKSLSVKSIKTDNLSEHIVHHLCIIRLAKLINSIFSQVIFVQFFTSILILCLSVYYLSSHMTVEDFTTWILFILSMFVQIFVYCWAGNEIILQSTGLSEAVYHMDWTLMTISERKDLLMIMKRSTRPVKFTSSFLVTLSLESYTNLMKTSYSAFNVLQSS